MIINGFSFKYTLLYDLNFSKKIVRGLCKTLVEGPSHFGPIYTYKNLLINGIIEVMQPIIKSHVLLIKIIEDILNDQVVSTL